MSGRDLGLQPKRKVEGFKAKPTGRRKQAHVDPQAEAVVVSAVRSPASTKRRSGRRARRPSTRRRVHVSMRLSTVEALMREVEERHATNTSVLIEALTARPGPNNGTVELTGFEPRTPGERRTTVTFYLGAGEIDRIDTMADSAGFATRSAYLDAALHAHLVAPGVAE